MSENMVSENKWSELSTKDMILIIESKIAETRILLQNLTAMQDYLKTKNEK